MQKLKALYKKHELIIKYLLFGAITTVISLFVCYVTVKTAALVWHDENGNPTALADILGSITQWVSGVLVAFFTNKLWVFTNAERGAKATVNARLDENMNVVTEGAQVLLGGNDRYIAMCHKCWQEKIRNQNK